MNNLRYFGARAAVLTACVALLTPVAAVSEVRAQAPTGKVLNLGIAASGVIAKVLVANSAHVDAGQILLQLDCRPLEAEIKLRAANRDAAEAAYQRTKNGPRLDEIAIGEANVGVAQARAEEAQAAYARLQAMTEGVSVTRAQLLEGRRDARVTAAQLEDSRKRLALLQAGSREEDIAESRARGDAAGAELDLAQARLEQCSLRAPVPGTVQIIATLGEFVSVSIPSTLARLTPDGSAP
jgi:multidrug resistance efflux pump